MDGEMLLRWLGMLAAVLHERRDALNALDAAIGDGDHGTNMDRGFAAVAARVPEWRAGVQEGTLDAGGILKGTATTLISTVGGASGPLYGTAFLRAGGALAGATDPIGGAAFVAALEAAANGVAARGRATSGEKTMLDAFLPAVAAMRAAVDAGRDLPEAASAAAGVAEEGMRNTIPMVATKGRAANLGPRSAGHQDPGATSTALLFRTLAEALADTVRV